MKVLFDHPNPFLLAHGGFQIQIEQTKLALERAGVEVDWLRWWDPGQNAHLIHYFGRAHSSYIEQCHQKGMRVVMSELLTGQGSRPASIRLLQRVLMKVAHRMLPKDFTSRLSWDSYQRVDAAIALTEWEKKLMVELFSAPADRLHVVPNGVEKVFLEPPGNQARGNHLVTTVTITPRKRVVELVQAAAMAGVRLRVIGRPYHPEDPHYLDFLGALKQAGGMVEYVGAIEDRKKLAQEYRSAAGFVLLSSMESQSLSALEAAACGCPLLLSDLPWAKVSFGKGATYAPLAPVGRTAAYLRRFSDGIVNAPRAGKVPSWGEVATQLAKVYRIAMTSR